MSEPNNRINHRKCEPPAVAQVWATELEPGDKVVTAAGIRKIANMFVFHHTGKDDVVCEFEEGGQLLWKHRGKALLVFE